MLITASRGYAFYLPFPLVSAADPATFLSGATPSVAAYSRDGAGTWTTMAVADTPAEIGSTGIYEVVISSSETTHDQVLLKITASGAAATAFLIDTKSSRSSVWDVQRVDHSSPGSMGEAMNTLVSGSIAVDESNNTFSFTAESGLSTQDDYYVGQMLTFTDGDMAGQTRRVTDYDGSTRTFSFAAEWPSAPVAGDAFVIYGRADAS